MTQKIRVVEDEPAIGDNTAYALETEGYGVVSSSTGQGALTLGRRPGWFSTDGFRHRAGDVTSYFDSHHTCS